ncbi:MAG TPA: hypothetical protein VFO60_02260 [Candidatus Dormibacteraeota bacterium]|nr:hypothetical protein [Candidatus Dormibacteraeota bacterium]
MAIVLKTRGAGELTWPSETERQRDHRRAALCELDGILVQLEEINVRGMQVPGRVRMALNRYGIPAASAMGAPALIEAIFEVQERFMLHPESTAPLSVGCARDIEELRRRMAC